MSVILEIAVCDDGKDLNTISDMLHQICVELKQEYHISMYRSSDEILSGNKVIDIGILGIVMPDCDGIELGRKLKERFSEIALIYITSNKNYYSQVINEVHAFSYLMKPLDKAELKYQITECVQEKVKKKQHETIVFQNVRDGKDNEYAFIRLNVGEILYCEYMKMQREVAIILENEVYFYKEVFGRLSKQLENHGFAVNRRGCVVNLFHIKKIKGYTIYLDNGEELPLTQKRVSDFKEKMNAYIYNK